MSESSSSYQGGGSTSGGSEGEEKSVGEAEASFVCNICLDPVKDPVITQCGHLYCWSCLYRWLNTQHTTCPVCKAGVSKENVIPLFIRGSEQDPRSNMPVSTTGGGGGSGGVSVQGSVGSGGDNGSATTDQAGNNVVPNRPHGRRLEPQNNTGGGAGMQNLQAQYGGISFSGSFGFFPSLFSLQFQSFAPAHVPNNRPPNSDELQEEFLSKVLFGLGSAVVLCLLLF